MTTVTRKQFIVELGQGEININELSPETKAKLAENRVSTGELKKIAGADGRISGSDEASRLFTLIDKFDANGSSRSIDCADSSGVLKPAGELYEALKAEIERNRQSAKNKGIIHLGMRTGSSKEAAALEKANPTENGGVSRVEAYKSRGVIEYHGKQFDLQSSDGLRLFRDALVSGPDKMPTGKANEFVDFLADQAASARDELAQLGLNFFQAGKGELPVSRLVLSGHGSPMGGIMGDQPGESFALEDIERLAKVFPEGAGKIEHLAISSCFGASAQAFNTLQSAFPNLKSAFAYNQFAPAADGRSPADLTKWAQMTSGDPGQVDPTIPKTATWNIADGAQGLPKYSLEEMEKRQKEFEPIFLEYQSGKKDKKLAHHDRKLDEYYLRLADLVRNPSISEDRKREVAQRLNDALRLRHPELFV